MSEATKIIVRHFCEKDRAKIVELFQNEGFMEYSADGQFDEVGANKRFDEILEYSTRGLGKQAIIFAGSSELVGYCGVEPFQLNGREELELGYRVVKKHRGTGIATEAALKVSMQYHSNLYAYVEPENEASIRVLVKIGFRKSGQCHVNGTSYDLYKKNT